MHVDQRSILGDLLSDRPTRANLRSYAALAHATALAYLRTRVRRGRLDPSYFGLSLEDLAFDTIAPLFERNEDGAFIVLRNYYETLEWSRLSATTLESVTRRLIFGRVNEALFEAYREHDPALGRIIRNLKIWIGRSEQLHLARINGRLWVLHRGTCDHRHLPVASEEYVESHLISVVACEGTSDKIVAEIEALLSYGGAYRGAYPLTALSRILKSCYERLHQPKTVEPPRVAARLTRLETHELIHESVAEVKRRMYETYVTTGKLDEREYTIYFHAIHERLTAEYVNFDSREHTNYKVLHEMMPTLSHEDYRSRHRPVFEYLSKLTRNKVHETLKKAHSTYRVS